MTTSRNPSDDITRTFVQIGAGTKVAHYVIIERIGAGGMGEVYLAEDTKLNRRVALKFMPTSMAKDPELRQRFTREAQAAAKLDHPNIVTIHEVSEYNDRPYFAMQYIEGKTLRHYCRDEKLSFEQIVTVGAQLAEGLAEAHALGVIHRDIKSANVILDKELRPRILDFGLATIRGGESLTKIGSTLGTIAYMSPEQAQGKEVDHRTDLFSLGVVLYELVAGRTPFHSDTEAAMLHRIINEPPEPLTRYTNDAPHELQRIITRSLAKKPKERFQSGTDFAMELRELTRSSHSGIRLSSSAQDATPSIAVLPFSNLSADPDQEYFCDGIAEDIISDLNQLQGLRVVARTSAFVFKGQSEDVRAIGEKLDVAFVLEGSVRKSKNRVRVTAQLIEVETGYQLWSKKYDRELEDIFAIQDDIAQSIVSELKLEISKKHGPSATTDTVPFEAYQLYSRGRYETNKRSSKALREGLDYLLSSKKLAPEYAPTLAGIAETYFLMYAYDLMTPRDSIARARANAQNAIAIDETLADAHVTLGGILTYYDWAWKDAEKSFERALSIVPGHATAHQWYGELLSFCGRKVEAEEHYQSAYRLNPLSPTVVTMMGWHFVRFKEYQEALQHLTRAEQMGSSNDFTYALTAYCYSAMGDTRKAIEHLDEGMKLTEATEVMITLRALLSASIGDQEPAREALERFRTISETTYVSQPYLSALHLTLGEEDEAVSCLHEALRRRDAELIQMAVMPYYADVRNNPRLSSLLAVLDLPAD